MAQKAWRLRPEARTRLGAFGKRYVVWRDGEPLQAFDDVQEAKVACWRYDGRPPAVFGYIVDLQKEAVIDAACGKLLDPNEAWRLFRLNPRYEASLVELFGELPAFTEGNVLQAPAEWLLHWRGLSPIPWPLPDYGTSVSAWSDNMHAWARELIGIRNAREAERT